VRQIQLQGRLKALKNYANTHQTGDNNRLYNSPSMSKQTIAIYNNKIKYSFIIIRHNVKQISK